MFGTLAFPTGGLSTVDGKFKLDNYHHHQGGEGRGRIAEKCSYGRDARGNHVIRRVLQLLDIGGMGVSARRGNLI